MRRKSVAIVMNLENNMKKTDQNNEPIELMWGCFHLRLPAWVAKGPRLPLCYLTLALLAWWLWLIHR